jgi:NADH dehydrogenase
MTTAQRVLLIGGSGFIGSSVAARLSTAGMDITIPTRRLSRAMHLALLPTVHIVEADISQAGTLERLATGMDAVIYLPGVLNGNFELVHVTLPERAACAAVAARVSRFVLMSALGASMTAPSKYLQTKERGEAAVLRVCEPFKAMQVSILRPSVVFGEGDKFLNTFARLAALAPFIPLGSTSALFQPVWVEDVARAVERCLTDPAASGRTWPLVGPRIYTLRELVEIAMRLAGHQRFIVPLGKGLAALQALVFEHLPGSLITRDNVASMQVPNTSDTPYPFGQAAELETIAAGYLTRARHVDDYCRKRETAGR